MTDRAKSQASDYFISFLDLLLCNKKGESGFSPFSHIFNTIADWERLKIQLSDALKSPQGTRLAELSSADRDYDLFLFTLSRKLGDVFDQEIKRIINQGQLMNSKIRYKVGLKNGNSNPEKK